MASLPDPATRISTARADFAAFRPLIEAREPWPLSDNFGTEPEASWGPRETLAHVQEMLPFWLGEIERVLEASGPGGSGEEPAFGRLAGDQIRLEIIERDRTLPLRELFDRIDTGIERILRRLPYLAESDFGRRGLHPRLGSMTVADILERFVAGHLEEHIDQLRDILGRHRA